MTEESPPNKDEGQLRTQRRSTRGRISFVWAIPILAVLIGASLVLRTFMEKGPTIEIHFPAAEGIHAGATPIKYLDVEIGVVQELRLNESRDGVIAVAELDAEAASYLVEGTIFWLVQPRVSLAGISGIETLLSGQYIEVIPASSGAPRSSFEGQLTPPIGARYADGKSIVLETESLSSIDRGTPLYHRGVQAGEVEHYELPDGDGPIRVYVMIDEAFTGRVRENTLFWNASGIDARVGLDGIAVRTEGLGAVLLAGIAFGSPKADAPEAESGSVFRLHTGADEALDSRLLLEGLAIHLESRSGVGLTAGTPIEYRGLAVGRLGESRLTADAQAVRLEAFIEPAFRALVRKGTRFYKSSGVDFSLGLDGVRVRSESLRSVALGGISIAVPERDSDPAESGALFALYDEPREAWLRWEPVVALGEAASTSPVEHALPPRPNAGAIELTLVAEEAGGLSAGSPVSYRNVAVGEVVRSTLHDDGATVEVRIRVDAAHRRLVGSQTRFWRVAGFRMNLDISGLDLDIGSLRELALGGVAFANPEGQGEAPAWGSRFPLHPSRDVALSDQLDAEYLLVIVEAHESGLSEGAPVYYRKHAIGEVGASRLTSDARAVRVELRIRRSHAALVRENSRFWSPDAVSIEASLAGVDVAAAPMQALLAGGVMIATPGDPGPLAEVGAVFRLDASAPVGWEHWHPELPLPGSELARFALDEEQARVHMVLVATNVDSVGEGDPVFFRGLQIGRLGKSKLADDGTEVLVDALIAPEYAAVIRSNTRFWNASGFGVRVGWGGAEADIGPLETLVRGGVQVATPEPAGERARSGHRFTLHAEPEEGWQDWSPILR